MHSTENLEPGQLRHSSKKGIANDVTKGTNQIIRCLPRGVCSWDFYLTSEGQEADLEIDWGFEQGSIKIDDVVLDIKKHGAFSGHWTLEVEGKVIASAKKEDAFRRTFMIEDAAGLWTLKAISAFGRSFQILEGSSVVATIRPDHAFTRRATIELQSSSLSFSSAAFAFWLAILMWKRNANNNS